ncbi:hypothetical protein BDN71DRAFT_1400976 [Pleurotus eryngii]|uniref:Uncharacterized protein n=1 Tax=Pleurotus eryngii TaxID=5323 RepID=A0A9P6D3N1_PLEER|nr:hypothetical protein BDN71DRAFT_1400976 [Pleurotus eryngii]
MKQRVLKARLRSVQEFEKKYAEVIWTFKFKPGDLVLIRDAARDKDLSGKYRARYFGPLRVVRQKAAGTYELMELDGTVSKHRYSTNRLVPYFPRNPDKLPTPIPSTDELD